MQQTKIDELLSANPDLAKKVEDLLKSEIKETHNCLLE